MKTSGLITGGHDKLGVWNLLLTFNNTGRRDLFMKRGTKASSRSITLYTKLFVVSVHFEVN